MTPHHFCTHIRGKRGAPKAAVPLLPQRPPHKSGGGFTLIETLIAVTILTLAVTGPLVTANRSIVAARVSRDQLTASYLAQEGIEYVRAMRDNAYLAAYRAGGADVSERAWNDFRSSIADCRTAALGSAPFCTYDPTSLTPVQACSGACAPLKLSATHIYNRSSGTATPFTRTVQAMSATATDEKIVSTVSWSYHGSSYSVAVTGHLTPWQ